MNLLIRADASKEIGTGHLMRSVALAQAWRGTRGGVSFMCHCESDALQKRILAEGFGLTVIKRPHPDPSDLETTLSFLKKLHPEDGPGSPWLVLDGYHFDPIYQKASRDAGFKVLVIDDYNHQSHYHADILLNQNIMAESLEYRCDPDTVLLLGTKYALLRDEFLAQEGKRHEAPGIARKILVTLGGADPHNVMLEVVQALKLLDIKGLEVKIVVGPANPHSGEIEEEIQKDQRTALAFQIVRNVDMPELMTWADVAVSAGGITSWELAFMGVPFLAFTLAENQRDIGPKLQDAGAAIDLGWPDQVDIAQLSGALDGLLVDPDRRRKMSSRAKKLVDGQGAKRVASLMAWLSTGGEDMEVTIREASPEDCKQTWLLSNDREVRENSFNTEPIVFENHILWYKEKLASPDTAFYVLDVHGVIGGQIRYGRKGNAAEINYSVAPAFRGKGLGKALIESTIDQACNRLRVDRVLGIVKNFNNASIRTFLNAGFKKVRDENIHNLDCSIFERSRSQDERHAR